MSLSNKRVVVMGLGHFGGGVGVSRFLVKHGANVLITDRAPTQQLQDSVTQLADLPVAYRLGEHLVSDFTDADLIVVNPAVDPRNNRFLHAAGSAGVPITSEIQLLTQRLPQRDRTIGVTGTTGKSTVTAMIGHSLSQFIGEDHVHIGGNLGGSLLDKLDQISEDDWVVLELSSFMLESLAEDRWSPHIAVITNFWPNHLDRHGSVEAYRCAKQMILDHQDDNDIAILGPGTHGRFKPNVQRVLLREEDDERVDEKLRLMLPGLHNKTNASLAADAAEAAIQVDWWQAAKALEDFSGLPHRLQAVAEHNNVRYFNDSKSTTPDSAKIALECFDQGIVHVVLGGYDKGSDLGELARFAAKRCRAIYTIGATGDAIAKQAEGGGAEVIRCRTLNRAVSETVSRVRSGDVVLLSPACASWDQFENFEKRGAAFVDAVLSHTSEGAPT